MNIAFEQSGDGPPVLLLHGGISDSREWRPLIDELADEFTLVAWDAPGCGRSSDPPEWFRLPDYADCLAALAEELGLKRPHVVGLSFGAALALELYRRHPTVPRTLVLASAYAGWAGSLPEHIVAERLQGALRMSELSAQEFVADWLPSLLTDRATPEIREELVAIMSAFHPAGARVMAHSMADADLRDVLPLIDVSTLLLYGEADERSPLPVAEELHAGIRGSTLVLIPGAGHQSNLEAPQRFNDAVRRFLRSSAVS